VIRSTRSDHGRGLIAAATMPVARDDLLKGFLWPDARGEAEFRAYI